jgi:hypothetical protein
MPQPLMPPPMMKRSTISGRWLLVTCPILEMNDKNVKQIFGSVNKFIRFVI